MIDNEWSVCTRCLRWKKRKKVCSARGDPHAEILGILPYPTSADDLIGKTLSGQGYKLFQKALKHASSLARVEPPSILLVYACACGKGLPTTEEFWICSQRLRDIAEMVKPKRVIVFGKPALSVCQKNFPGCIPAQNPSLVAAFGGIGSPMYMQFVRTLSSVICEVKENSDGVVQ